jgi:hypothetical protein
MLERAGVDGRDDTFVALLVSNVIFGAAKYGSTGGP